MPPRLRFFGLCQGPGLHHEHFGVLILAVERREARPSSSRLALFGSQSLWTA